MLSLNFISEEEFSPAAKEYELIWQQAGTKIVNKFKELSGLDFVEKSVYVIVFEGISNSGMVNTSPIRLRASNDHNHKIAALTHELGHRLLFGNKIKKEGLGIHQLLDLILYDLWVDTYGKNFADGQVERESNRVNPVAPYKECWQWALSLTREERHKKIREITRQSIGP